MSTERGAVLIALARAAIADALGLPAPAVEDAPWLNEFRATFVTLRHRGELRGCVGSLVAERRLRDDVARNARAAAFADSRFPPLAGWEYPELRVEVTLLSALQEIEVGSEAELLSRLRPGVDGVVLAHGAHQATYLPQVWEQLPEPRQFLEHLKRKAGLPGDFWARDVKVWRYTVAKWCEDAMRREDCER